MCGFISHVQPFHILAGPLAPQGVPRTQSKLQYWGLRKNNASDRFRGGVARSPGQKDPGLAAPPHGVEHAWLAAAAAHGGQSDSLYRAQKPGHGSLAATGQHPASRVRVAIKWTKLPALARRDDARPRVAGSVGGT